MGTEPDLEWQRELLVPYDGLGDVAVSTGKLDDARGWFDKALALAQKLTAADPSNIQWQRDLCTILVKIAPVARDQTEAMRHLDEARVIYSRLKRGGFFHGDEQFPRIGTALDQLAHIRMAAKH